MNTRSTQLLILLIVTATASVVLGYMRFDKQRDDALTASRNLGVCRRQLDALAAAKASPGGLSPVSADSADLHRRLRGAATAADISDAQQASVEPGQPTRVPNTDYQEFPVFVRLDRVTMKQLTLFLSELARRDIGSRAKTIELTPVPGDDPIERWTADISIAYLIYTPRPAGKDQPRRPAFVIQPARCVDPFFQRGRRAAVGPHAGAEHDNRIRRAAIVRARGCLWRQSRPPSRRA